MSGSQDLDKIIGLLGSLPRVGVIVIDGKWVVPIALALAFLAIGAICGLISGIKVAKEIKNIERRKEEDEWKRH